MKRSSVILSWVLILAMIMSLCACSNNGSSERKDRDEERSRNEQDEDDVDETKESREGKATETEGSETPYSLGSGILTMSELMEITENCLGMQADEGVCYLAASLGISEYEDASIAKTVDEYSEGNVDTRYLYSFDRNPSVEGYEFKRIHVWISQENRVEFIEYYSIMQMYTSDKVDDETVEFDLGFPVDEASEVFRSRLTSLYGEPEAGEHSYRWHYGALDLNLIFYKDYGKVAGQNYLSFNVRNPELHITPSPTPTPDPNNEIRNVVDMLNSVIGSDIETAEKLLSECLNIRLNKEKPETYEYDKTIQYIYDEEFVIAGYEFDEIHLLVDAESGLITKVVLFSYFDDEDYYQMFRELLTNLMGSPKEAGSDNNAKQSTFEQNNGKTIELSNNNALTISIYI